MIKFLSTLFKNQRKVSISEIQSDHVMNMIAKSSDAVAAFDRKMNYIAANQAYIDFYFGKNVTMDSIKGTRHFVNKLKIPERWKKIHKRVLAGETLRSMSPLKPNSSGQIEWAVWDMSPLTVNGDEIFGSLIILKPVNGCERRHDAVIESHLEFRHLADCLPAMCWTTDSDGTPTWFNERWREYTGLNFIELLDGEKRFKLYMPSTTSLMKEKWQKALQERMPFEYTTVILGKDGLYRSFLTRVVPVRNDRDVVTHWIGTHFDISSMGQTIEELQTRVTQEIKSREAMQDKLLQLEKMNIVGQLAGGIAHDFNNILQSIGGNTELMARNLNNPEKIQKFTNNISESVRRGAAVSKRLLSFVRKGELRPEPVNVEQLLDGMYEIFKNSFGNHITVNVEKFGAALPVIEIDRGQLESALSHVMTNARDAIPKDTQGTITIAVNTTRGGKLGVPRGDWLEISISDTGTGMSETVLNRAGEPFFTTKGTGQGTGLGLPMARGFAEQSGGGLLITSQENIGTKVIIYLPLGQAVKTYKRIDRDKKRILLVNDNKDMLFQHLTLLSTNGYEVITTANGVAAASILNYPLELDLIISNLAIAENNVVDLIKRSQLHNPKLSAILFINSAEQNSLAMSSILDGKFALVAKSVEDDDLLSHVAVILDDTVAKQDNEDLFCLAAAS